MTKVLSGARGAFFENPPAGQSTAAKWIPLLPPTGPIYRGQVPSGPRGVEQGWARPGIRALYRESRLGTPPLPPRLVMHFWNFNMGQLFKHSRFVEWIRVFPRQSMGTRIITWKLKSTFGKHSVSLPCKFCSRILWGVLLFATCLLSVGWTTTLVLFKDFLFAAFCLRCLPVLSVSIGLSGLSHTAVEHRLWNGHTTPCDNISPLSVVKWITCHHVEEKFLFLFDVNCDINGILSSAVCKIF